MSNNALVTLRYVTYHLNFSRFSIAKIFHSLNYYFISCPFFADILLSILIEEKEETSLV